LQPARVIPMAVQSFCRTLTAVVLPDALRTPGREIVQQSPCPRSLIAHSEASMQMLSLVEKTAHSSHDSIQHVAGSMPVRMLVGHDPQMLLVAQIQHLRASWTRWQMLFAPTLQFTQPTAEGRDRRRFVGVPHLIADIPKLRQMLATVTYLQPTVQEAPQQGSVPEEVLPGGNRTLPAIGVDRLQFPSISQASARKMP